MLSCHRATLKSEDNMSIKTSTRALIMKTLVQSRTKHISLLESEMFQVDCTIKATEASPERFEILDEMPKLVSDKAHLAGFPRTLPLILSSISDIKRSLKDLASNPSKPKAEISCEELSELEQMCQTLGVGKVGYSKVPQYYIFQGKAILYDNAIVLTMEMDKEKLNSAPSHATGVMIHQTYNKLGRASLKVSDWLRSKGFGAHAGHALMGQVLYPALAVKAGMGWNGKHGMLITPEFGPRLRLAAIYTSITNLPINRNNPHTWIEEFCNACKLCVKKCPGQAIFDQSTVENNGMIKAIDTSKCFRVFAEQNGCSVCMKVCPFNQVGYQKLQKAFMKKQKG